MKHLLFIISIVVLTITCNAQTCYVEDFGAIADNKTNNMKAIQNAIDNCSQQAFGGTVVLSKGIYLSGTIELKSNVNLKVEYGATLKAFPDTSTIRRIIPSVESRIDLFPRKAFIFADSQQNIVISGGGTIDGSGYEKCFSDGIEDSPNRHFGILIINCSNMLVENISLTSSSFWMQRYFNCKKVRLHGLNVYNHVNLNNDGIDIDSSDDVIISDCFIDSSDDGICIKSEGKNPSKNIAITNCIVASHASAIKLGTGSIGGFENISISNCIIRRSESKKMLHAYGIWGGLTGIELLTTDGGPLRNVTINNISIEDVLNPIHIRLGNRLSRTLHKPNSGIVGTDSITTKPEFTLENIIISNITGKNTGPYPIIIAGHENHPVKRVTLRDITITTGQAGSKNYNGIKTNWLADKYPGYRMYGTELPAYGIVSNFTENFLIENVKVLPSVGEFRPFEKHFNRK